MIRLTLAALAAFTAGFTIMFRRNLRSEEHNSITGTGRPA